MATALCLQLLLTTASHPVTRFTTTVAFPLPAMTLGPGRGSDSDLSPVGVGFVLRAQVQALGRMQWVSEEKLRKLSIKCLSPLTTNIKIQNGSFMSINSDIRALEFNNHIPWIQEYTMTH